MMATIGGRNMWEVKLFIMQSIYMSVYAPFGLFLIMNHQCMVMNHLKTPISFHSTRLDNTNTSFS